MKTLALFDFDETLYKKDSLLEFTKFCHGNQAYILGMLKLLPSLLAMKAGFVTNEKMKKKFIAHFFKNWDYDYFKEKGILFSKLIDKDIDQTIFTKFQQHLEQQHEVIIVTASLPEWILPWSKKFQVKVIGTQIKISDNKIIPDFQSPNCNGKEKVIRIKKSINLNDFHSIYVYGKGKGDREMLLLKK